MRKIETNIIMVVPNEKKKKILLDCSSNKKLNSIKYMTLEELMQNLMIVPKKEAIYYLMKDLHLSYALASIYLKNIPHMTGIKESKYENVKKLLTIKQYLEENHLLVDNSSFLAYLKGKQIQIEGYVLTKEQKNLLKQLEPETTIVIKEDSEIIYTHPLYAFETMDEEIAFIASDIASKLKKGIAIDQIYLANVSEEYRVSLHRIFHMYQIPLEEKSTHILYGNPIVQKWLKSLEEDAEYALEQVENTLYKEEEQQIYTQLLQIYNDYIMVPKDELWKLCIKEACKQTILSIPKRRHVVAIKDLKTTEFHENEFIYILGMNQEHIPTIKKDEDYLNDEICNDLNLDNTEDKNKLEKEILVRKINAIPNAILTYKKKTSFGTYYPSSLLTHLKVENAVAPISYHDSDVWNKMKLAQFLDQYKQYNEKDENLDLLYAHYPEIPYDAYDNQYKPIAKQTLKEYLNGKLTLSYTSLDRYNRCGFRYYINNILKLDPYIETFAIQIGNLFHYFLSIAFNDTFVFETEWEQYHKEKTYTAKEAFFLNKLKQELKFVIATIQEQNQYTKLQQEEYEQKIFKSISGNLKITFMGIVDKIKYKEEDGTIYAAIIDYKTGTLETNLNQSIYGIGMQLPIYLYLLKNKPDWKNVKVVGFYLQKMIQNEMNNDENDDYLEMKKDAMRLEGYSSDDPSVVEKLDETYLDSRIIKGMKVSSKGFYAYTKVMSELKMDKLSALVENKIEESAHKIEEADFKINPKQIGAKLVGCEFCTYHDLCFQTTKDIEYLKEYKKLEFLEEDAV